MNCLTTKLLLLQNNYFLLINLRLGQEKRQHVRGFVNTIHKLEITQSLISHQDRKQLLVHNEKKTHNHQTVTPSSGFDLSIMFHFRQ